MLPLLEEMESRGVDNFAGIKYTGLYETRAFPGTCGPRQICTGVCMRAHEPYGDYDTCHQVCCAL